MNTDPALADHERGLEAKFRAFKIDTMAYELALNLTDPDRQHIKIGGIPQIEVTVPFFLVQFDDPFAPNALRAYGRDCEFKYPKLAEDLRTKLRETVMLRASKENHE